MEKFKVQNLGSKIMMALIAAAVFIADQFTKSLVESHISEGASVHVIPGFFNLINTKNPGAVFGLFAESPVWWKTPLLVAVSAVLLIVVLLMVIRSKNMRWVTRVGLALVLGGAFSNLSDRIRWGTVEDFLDFYYRNYHWATFNLADSAIVAGTGLIIIHVLFGE
jgi:signal peptidase II